MSDPNSVHAPYNFVPFSTSILTRDTELPGHDTLHGELKTGEIQVTLRSETPVFVSDGGSASGKKEELHFFRLPNGEFAIPGSTVRGMIRQNMQILGFGLLRAKEDLEDYQIYFREIASKSESLGKQYYRKVLDIKTKQSPEIRKTLSRAERVCSGYLYCKADRYWILPTREPYYRISRNHPDLKQFGPGDARTIPVSFRATNSRVKEFRPADNADRRGMLLFTGKAVRKPNARYLFPEPDEDAPEIAVSKEDILAYQIDLENRRNALRGSKDKQDLRDDREWLSFWELPKDSESKPVFYLRHEGHLYFGMSQFLRIGYPHSLAEGLPQSHRELAATEDTLDYPRAVFGFANKNSAFRSRVSFGDFPAEPGAKESAAVSMILGQPKPSYYPGYVQEGKNYTQADFQLRGYKQYWLKEARPAGVGDGKERVGSTLRPLPKGTVFHGVVRFHNLTAEELGLLLWSLRLEEGCFQSLGMGKPYGYGRMRLEIDSLRLLDPNILYGADLDADFWQNETARIADFIARYDAYAAEKLRIKKPKNRPSITSRPEIQDFFYMKRTIRTGQETAYMTLDEYKNMRTPLPTVAELREEENTRSPQEAMPPKPASDGALDLSVLLKKFNSVI